MGPARAVSTCAFTLALAAAVLVPPTAADDPPPQLSETQLTETCARLFRNLADDDWKVRETAGEGLRALGKQALRPMAGEFRRSRDPEVRSRLQEIAREFYWRQVVGFLGISMQAARFEADGGVYVSSVLAGTAAERAGLQSEDVIVVFAGKDMRGIRTQEDLAIFSRAVQDRGVGVPTRIEIMRNGQHRVLTAALGPMPEEKLREYLDSLEPESLSRFEEWWKAQVAAAAPAVKSAGAGPRS
jgi:C-terminal processing protease CtpA/Prc